MNQPHQPDSLSPENLHHFVAGIAGLPRDEIRKAKSLYVRNAISEYKALDESFRAVGFIQLLFAIIPFFWPFLYAQRREMAAKRQLTVDRIRNALAVWKDDLEGEKFDFDPDDPLA